MVPRRNKLRISGFPICVALFLFASATLARASLPSIDQVYQAARAEHAERLSRLEAVQQELLTLYQAVTRRCPVDGLPSSTDEARVMPTYMMRRSSSVRA